METFYRRYQSRLPPFLYRLTQDKALIEETYNDVMLKVWRKAHQYRGQSMVSSWVFAIGYRACLKLLKKEQRQTGGHINRAQLAETDTDATYASEAAEHNARLVHRALAGLSADHRLVVELAYFQGFSVIEIADIANRPVNTIKTRLHHARRHMRKILGEQYGS